MFSFRLNLSTNEVEILVNGFVKFSVDKADFPEFAHGAWLEAKNPTQMRRVRDLIDYTFK